MQNGYRAEAVLHGEHPELAAAVGWAVPAGPTEGFGCTLTVEAEQGRYPALNKL